MERSQVRDAGAAEGPRRGGLGRRRGGGGAWSAVSAGDRDGCARGRRTSPADAAVGAPRSRAGPGDAQREAAEHWVRSQAAAGWEVLPARYDDGGFSGGNIDRPARTRLGRQPARVSRQLALAYDLRRRLDAGEFADYASMARALGFSRNRITQIMDLLLLAPDIQDESLFLEFLPGRQPINEAHLQRSVLRTIE